MPNFAVNFGMPAGLGIGGSTLWSMQLASALAERGWRTNLLVHKTFDASPRVDPAQWPGLNCVHVPGAFPGKAKPWDIWRYTRAYRGVAPGIYIPNWSDGIFAACARLAQRQPEAVRILSVVHGINAGHRAANLKYESVIARFVAVSEEVAAPLREALPHREGDIIVRSCPVVVPEVLTREWRTDGPLRLVYAGRVTNHEKKVSRLIPLAEMLAARSLPFTLAIYGDGGYLPTLRHEYKQASSAVRDAVTIHGQVEPQRMPEIWREADICLLVSDAEGSPLCVMEAMAQGCVPVAMRVSGVPALVKDGVTGWSVPPGDLEGMVERIQRLEQDRSSLRTLGEAAHAHVKAHFSFDAYVPWFEGLLAEVWAERV